jgi:hypothetical protein
LLYLQILMISLKIFFIFIQLKYCIIFLGNSSLIHYVKSLLINFQIFMNFCLFLIYRYSTNFISFWYFKMYWNSSYGLVHLGERLTCTQKEVFLVFRWSSVDVSFRPIWVLFNYSSSLHCFFVDLSCRLLNMVYPSLLLLLLSCSFVPSVV